MKGEHDSLDLLETISDMISYVVKQSFLNKSTNVTVHVITGILGSMAGRTGIRVAICPRVDQS